MEVGEPGSERHDSKHDAIQMVDTERLISALERARFRGPVIDVGHRDYEKLRLVWNALIDRRPHAIARAVDAEDVAKVVSIAAEDGILLAVRCGAHSLPGLSTCDHGVVLDLSLMRDISIDPVSRIAAVAGGALLGDIDEAGSRHGLVTPAGVVSHTGVGGLTLGGGMGWLSRRFGLTIDNLLSAEVVTADGKCMSASPDHDDELFWALRGGGGNFGVVTKFYFRMHPLGPVTVGRWLYPYAEAPLVLKRYGQTITQAPRELTTVFVITRDGLRITALWSGKTRFAESAFKSLSQLGTNLESSVGGIGFLQLQKLSDENARWGRRCYAKGGFLQSVDASVVDTIMDTMSTAPVPGSEIYVLQLGGAVADLDETETAYVGRTAGHYWLVETFWDDAADDNECISWSRKTAARMINHSLTGNYVNEQSEMGMAFSAYGEDKYRRLAQLKARYDRSNLFRLNQNIVPSTEMV